MSNESDRRPLDGLRVVELAGIGPAQLAAMLLADLGADVVRIDRAADAPAQRPTRPSRELLGRGRRSIALDLKQPGAIEWARKLADRADVLIDPYRPGVAARLGLDPGECLRRNPRLVFAQITGWGQDGPLAAAAGHDLNYTALAGALQPMGAAAEPPPVPLNLTADFGGGGMYLAAMVLAALHKREASGRGEVLDVAMVDGVATMLTSILQMRAEGIWSDQRGDNFLDGAAPFYRAYRTADDRFVSVGAIEPQFYRRLLIALELVPEEWPQWERELWPRLTARLEAIFAARHLEHWCELLEGSDACFAPVLGFEELDRHPHLRARATFVRRDGVLQPAPALAFGPGQEPAGAPWPGEQSGELLAELGIGTSEAERGFAGGWVAEPGRSPGPGPRSLAPQLA